MKYFILLLIMQASAITAYLVQCCNVYASNGKPVSSADVNCETLTYNTSDCYAAKLDTDYDGVSDDLDFCSTVKENALNKGCTTISVFVYNYGFTGIRVETY